MAEFDANGWCHDMSKAPRDGSSFLAFGQPQQHPKLETIFRRPHQFTAHWDLIDEAFCINGGDWQGPFIKPSAWQPLPRPPVKEQDQ